MAAYQSHRRLPLGRRRNPCRSPQAIAPTFRSSRVEPPLTYIRARSMCRPQHRRRNPHLARHPRQRPPTAFQQRHRFPFELGRKLPPRLRHKTPPGPRRLSKGVHQSEEPSESPKPKSLSYVPSSASPARPSTATSRQKAKSGPMARNCSAAPTADFGVRFRPVSHRSPLSGICGSKMSIDVCQAKFQYLPRFCFTKPPVYAILRNQRRKA